MCSIVFIYILDRFTFEIYFDECYTLQFRLATSCFTCFLSSGSLSCLLVSCIHRRHVTSNILTCNVYCFFFFFKWWPYAFRICSNNGTSTDVFPCKISSSLNKYSTGTESKNTHHKTKTTKQQNKCQSSNKIQRAFHHACRKHHHLLVARSPNFVKA